MNFAANKSLSETLAFCADDGDSSKLAWNLLFWALVSGPRKEFQRSLQRGTRLIEHWAGNYCELCRVITYVIRHEQAARFFVTANIN